MSDAEYRALRESAGAVELPRDFVRAAGPDAVVLADGFSCRTQLDQLAGRRALHLAELLASGGSRTG